jgi:hypothetical protein
MLILVFVNLNDSKKNSREKFGVQKFIVASFNKCFMNIPSPGGKKKRDEDILHQCSMEQKKTIYIRKNN